MYGLKPVPSKLKPLPSKLKPVPAKLTPMPSKLSHCPIFRFLRVQSTRSGFVAPSRSSIDLQFEKDCNPATVAQ